MFPDIRLLIVAVVASVVALSCGFGLFAALRVNHEPLARQQTDTAPLHLLPADITALSMTVAAVETLDRSIEMGEGRRGDDVADSQTPTRPDDVEASPVASVASIVPREPDAVETQEATGTVTPPAVPADSAAEQSIDQPVIALLNAIAKDDVADAPGTDPGPTPAPDAASDSSPSSPPQEIEPSTPEAGASAGGTIEAVTEQAPTPTLQAAVEPTDPTPSFEQKGQEIERAPASDTGAATDTGHRTGKKAAAKKKKKAHTHVASKGPHAHRLRARAVAQFDTQDFAAAQPNFQTAPQAFQGTSDGRPHRRAHRSRVTSRTTANTSSAAGGPFLSPASR